VVNGIESGHRHDREHVVVWVENGTARYVSTSAHGRFVVTAAAAVRWDGTHPKVVYHKDGAGSHAFRPAGWRLTAGRARTAAGGLPSAVSGGRPTRALRS
jgi:hypothetical protein